MWKMRLTKLWAVFYQKPVNQLTGFNMMWTLALNGLRKRFKRLASQCSYFIPPENTRKRLVWWLFSGGIKNGNISQKWISIILNLYWHFSSGVEDLVKVLLQNLNSEECDIIHTASRHASQVLMLCAGNLKCVKTKCWLEVSLCCFNNYVAFTISLN